MDTKAYQYLLTIHEQGSLSRAAQHLGISEPALSKFLQLTEEELQCHLFERSAKQLKASEAGLLYLHACREILDVKRKTYASIALLHQEPEETIRVGITPYRGSQVFSEIYAAFNERYPQVLLKSQEGYTTDLKEALDNGSLNLALGTLIPSDTNKFGFASSSHEQLCLALPLSHPAASQSNDSGTYFPVINIHSLSDIPFVMWGGKTTNALLIQHFLDQQHFHPTTIYTGNNALLVNEMLKNGIGAGFIPRSFCHARENRVYFSTWPPIESFIGVFFQKDRILSEAEQYFIYLVLLNTSHSNTSMNTYYNQIAQQILEHFGE